MQIGRTIEALEAPAAALLERPFPVSLPPLPGGAEAAVIHALRRVSGRTLVWVGHGQTALDSARRDLAALNGPDGDRPEIWHFPARDIPDSDPARQPVEFADPETEGSRMRTLRQLASGTAAAAAPVIVTEIQALFQPTPPPEAVVGSVIRFKAGEHADLSAAAARLAELGYEVVPAVVAPSQTAIKGGLIDLWSPGEQWPVRIEWFGDRVESLRAFDPADQLSVSRIAEALAVPAVEPAGAASSLRDFLPANTIFWWADPCALAEHAGTFLDAMAAAGLRPVAADFESLRRLFSGGSGAAVIDAHVIDSPPAPELPAFTRVPSVPVGTGTGDPFAPDFVEARRRQLVGELCERVSAGWRVIALLDTEGELHRFQADLPKGSGIETGTGSLSEGFLCPALRLAVVSESDIYGRKKLQFGRPGRRSPAQPDTGRQGERVGDLSTIEPGELVVHADHGIGRFLGLFEIMVEGRLQEVVSVEYDEGARLHVPVAQAHLLSRYTGVSRHKVRLHRLGGRRWARERKEAERAVADLAGALLETQAKREFLPGHAFGPDAPWQRDLEAAFPYRETRDQERAVADVKADMESGRPMDRLVCGDAGYGKTEVAIRAAFKAVTGGKQVAVLVPTTILAQQHLDTFRERMLPFPVKISVLSRFCSQPERRRTIEDIGSGAADVVIGTHALLQPGVRFRDLGLVIIDEEQRFGVRHKEWLKRLHATVDLLTMTATPIPRTLYYSLTGARDMSLIQTPPRERVAVETVIARNEDSVVRSAIVRELNRGGQVFYLHNRVMTIQRVARRLSELVPEARIAVAHGQMASGELSGIVRSFISGSCDVLLCTTIIESGVDIPRANTILVDRADRFGLADLYQLRGRVGRSNLKGHAYLLLPPRGPIEGEARKRMEALLRHSDLGAGFQLALRDMEIRGAGNLLGAQQSGHINAIGFGLYCQLLKRSVAALKGGKLPRVVETDVRLDFISLSAGKPDSPDSASIPSSYIEDEPLRIGIYRRIAEASDEEDVAALRTELADRFGPVPPPLDRFLKMVSLRVVCSAQGIRRVEIRDGKVMFEGISGLLMRGPRLPRLQQATTDLRLDEIIRLARTLRVWSR